MSEPMMVGDVIAGMVEDMTREEITFCPICKEATTREIQFGSKTRIVGRMCRCERQRVAERDEANRVRQEKERYEERIRRSGIDAKLKDASFDNFKVNEANSKAFKICKAYAENFSQMYDENRGILLYGTVGTGKSYLSACIANYLLNRGISVVMTSFAKILSAVQGDHEEEIELMNLLRNAKLVIFDDIGAERSTDYALEKVFNFIDERYRAHQPMIITTNNDFGKMKEEGDIRHSRIYDRIFEVCCPIALNGDSWRKGKGNENYIALMNLVKE